MSATAPVRQSERDKRALKDTFKAATLAEWRKRRELYVTLPSGVKVKVRPVNIERQALAGGLPAGLRRLAANARGSGGLNDVLEQALLAEDGEMDATLAEQRRYLDNLIRQMVVEPELPAELDLDDVILPVDYHFLLRIAQRELDYDAEGKYLWGAEPLSRWETFRAEHRCDEDCEACRKVQLAFSATYGG